MWNRLFLYTTDTRSPATSGRDLLNFEKKTLENATAKGFGLNLSGAAFCLAQPIGELLVPDCGGDGTESEVKGNVTGPDPLLYFENS